MPYRLYFFLCFIVIPNQYSMKKLLLVKEIYVEAFKDWTYKILNRYFKAFSWFCFFLLAIAAYALIYRVSTGYAFV